MERDGQQIIAYLGEDRQIYMHNPGKFLCEFPARVIRMGGKQVIHVTDVPDKFDGGMVKAPAGYELSGF